MRVCACVGGRGWLYQFFLRKKTVNELFNPIYLRSFSPGLDSLSSLEKRRQPSRQECSNHHFNFFSLSLFIQGDAFFPMLRVRHTQAWLIPGWDNTRTAQHCNYTSLWVIDVLFYHETLHTNHPRSRTTQNWHCILSLRLTTTRR